MIGGFPDVGFHIRDLGGRFTVSFHLGRPGVTMGSLADHTLTGVVERTSGQDLVNSPVLGPPQFSNGCAPQPVGARGRSSSRLKAGSKLRR